MRARRTASPSTRSASPASRLTPPPCCRRVTAPPTPCCSRRVPEGAASASSSTRWRGARPRSGVGGDGLVAAVERGGCADVCRLGRGPRARPCRRAPAGPPVGHRGECVLPARRRPGGQTEAALDGDPGTGWVAGEVDPPWFSVTLPEPRELDGLTFTKSFDLAASTPIEVRITFDDGTTTDAAHRLRGPCPLPQQADSHAAAGFRRRAAAREHRLGDEPSHVRAHRLQRAGAARCIGPADAVVGRPVDGVPCGFGPSIEVDGRRVLTSVTGRVGDVLTGRALRWQVCSDGSTLTTPAGTVHLRARATAEFAPAQLDLLGPGAPRRAAPRPRSGSIGRPPRRSSRRCRSARARRPSS